MPEPVTITLASVGLFIKFFGAFKSLYNGHQLTAAFGSDYQKFALRFSILCTKLESISTLKLSWLPEDVLDENSALKRAILDQLVLIRDDYDVCTGLISKYHAEGKHLE